MFAIKYTDTETSWTDNYSIHTDNPIKIKFGGSPSACGSETISSIFDNTSIVIPKLPQGEQFYNVNMYDKVSVTTSDPNCPVS